MATKKKININEMTDQELFEAVREHMMIFNKTLAPIDDPEKLLDAFLVYAMMLSYDLMPEESSRASAFIGLTWIKVIETTNQTDPKITKKIRKILSALDIKDPEDKLH